MGLLDEAIREHLDLKRQHGANEDELAQQEAEALGPVTEEDLSGPDGSDADAPDGEREAGWPFDRVAENELAEEPEEPSFEWSAGDSDEVEVPPFVPPEPVSDPRPGEDPELVDMPTQAFSAVDSPAAEEGDEGPGAASALEDDAFEKPPADDHETQLRHPGEATPDDAEEPFEPEAVDPLALEPEPLEEPHADGGSLPVETEEPLSEPDPLEPYPLGAVESGIEAEPSADPGGASLELGSPFEPSPDDEPPPADAEALGAEPAPEPALPGEEPAIGPDPAAEQGNPPGEMTPLEEELGPVTEAWSIETEPGFGASFEGEDPAFPAPAHVDEVTPAETSAVEEHPVIESMPGEEDGPDEELELPPEAESEPGPLDADLEPVPTAAEESLGEPPIAARGFFDETEDHEMLWRQDRPTPDPDFES